MPDLTFWEREWFRTFVPTLNHFTETHTKWVRGEDRNALRKETKGVSWVITHDWKRAWQFLSGKKSAKSRVCISVLGISIDKTLFPLLPWRSTQLPDEVCLLVHNELDRRFLIEILKFPESRVHFVELLQRMNCKSVDPKGGSEIIVGTLGQFIPEQNFNYFLSVAHYVTSKQPNVRFRIFGEGALYVHLTQVIRDLSLEKNCEIVEISDLGMLGSLDMFVYSPLSSHHFMPIHLAAEFGLPILCSEFAGVQKWVQDGHDGFVIPLNEIRPMGELILRLAADSRLRQSLGQAFKEKLFQTNTLFRMKEEIQQLLLGNNSGSKALSVAA